MRSLFVILFVSGVGLTGCEEKSTYVPSEDERQLVRAYAALLVLHERFGPTANPDSIQLYHRSLDSILQSHDLTRDQFREGFEDLVGSPDRFRPLLQEIAALLQQGVERR